MAGRAALSVSVKVCDHLTQVVAADDVLRGLPDNATVFLNGTFENGDVFPKDIVMKENDFLNT